MSSLPIRVGLMDTTGEIPADTMTAVAAALNVQVTRDLPQFWGVTATVSYLPGKKAVPQGIWPVQLVKSLPPGEGGFHMTKHNQPYAKVIATPGSLEWTIDASHETLEMLVDSAGNRLQTSTGIKISGKEVVDAPGTQFEYLIEVCDPCEADEFAYSIDGFSVSDFITPHYYDHGKTSGSRYSFTGKIERPRQLLEGGYISFVNPSADEMQQILWVDPGQPPQLRTLGPASGSSLRQFVEQQTHALVHATREKYRAKKPNDEAHHKAAREAFAKAAMHRGTQYYGLNSK
jgi:hypothetical protein